MNVMDARNHDADQVAANGAGRCEAADHAAAGFDPHDRARFAGVATSAILAELGRRCCCECCRE
jgi:hypothetical protein